MLSWRTAKAFRCNLNIKLPILVPLCICRGMLIHTLPHVHFIGVYCERCQSWIWASDSNSIRWRGCEGSCFFSLGVSLPPSRCCITSNDYNFECSFAKRWCTLKRGCLLKVEIDLPKGTTTHCYPAHCVWIVHDCAFSDASCLKIWDTIKLFSLTTQNLP